MGVVTGHCQCRYLIMKYPASLVSVHFWQNHPYFLINFGLKNLVYQLATTGDQLTA